MELVVGHENLDFDSLAASVAVARLYPGTVIGLPKRLSRPVRDFYSLHKERFPTRRLTDVDPTEVTKLTLVDVRDRRRLRHVEAVLARRDAGEPVELHVWDHHPAGPHDVTGDMEVVAPVGAVTTALLEALRARELDVDAFEATLYALAIHTDTASLTLATTTPRDAAQIPWLLERGARLSQVNRYLAPPFSGAQRDALATVLAQTRTLHIAGARIGIARIEVDKPVDGLAEVTSEACGLEGHHALFTLCALAKKRRVQVVGRARGLRVDVGGALRTLGGGGHRGAGSAVVKGKSAEVVEQLLVEALETRVKPPTQIGDLMSSPVRTLSPDLPLSEAGERLRAWDHTGAPVVEGGAVRGVISLRDVERAERKKRGALPVKSHMSGRVLTASPSTSLESALKTLVDADVGRLLVLREERLIGIVSRSDLLRALYPDSEP